MMTEQKLTQVFNDNFTAYFKSHVAHVNIMGRNFHGDHALLGEIYEDLQSQIDVIAEILRSITAFMPADLSDVVTMSHIGGTMEGNSDSMLAQVQTDLQHLKEMYAELMEAADEEEYDEIENYAQERILKLGKFLWMLTATLD